ENRATGELGGSLYLASNVSSQKGSENSDADFTEGAAILLLHSNTEFVSPVRAENQLDLLPNAGINQVRKVLPPLDCFAEKRRIGVGEHFALSIGDGNIRNEIVGANP